MLQPVRAATPAGPGHTADLRDSVAAAARGDRAAFTRLVEAYGNAVCSISLAIVGDVAASEDVAQEAFVSAWQRIHTLRNPASFLPWLRQLARNAARGYRRSAVRRRRRVNEPGPAALERALAAAVDPAPDAPTAMAQEEERAAVATAIASAMAELPEDAREVVILFYREGRSIAQVAALLGLTEEAAKKRLSRARARLREDLAARLGDALDRCAPGAAFVAAVSAALTTGAPATATAAAALAEGADALGGTKAAGAGAGSGGSGAGAAKAVAAASIGAATGLVGVLVGFRHYWRRARDDEERRGIRRLAAANAAAVLALSLSVAWTSSQPGTVAGDAATTIFLAVMGWINLVWLPRRVIGRRLAAERAEDPVGAPRRQRRERVLGIASLCVGEAIVLVSLAWHLVSR
jgi:RNA polymerase sigma factor (sigma-70 family)